MNKTSKVEEKGKGKLSKFPTSLILRKEEKVLHLLVNSKKGKSFDRMENFKFSTTILDSVLNGMNSEDFKYNTSILKIPYTLNSKELKKERKVDYLKVISLNEEFISLNKDFPNKKEILENMKFFKEEINKL